MEFEKIVVEGMFPPGWTSPCSPGPTWRSTSEVR